MQAASRQAFVGIGANLGDRATTLAAAAGRLKAQPMISSLEASSVYETEPIGEVNQPLFLNQVLGIETSLTPELLLRTLMAIEHEFGRTRTEKWGPRTLDLDLLAYEGETRDSAELQLPHPRMFSRAFVVVPLRELLQQPRFQIPAWDSLRVRLSEPIATQGVRCFQSR
jgi:2-amino-4-hydroxy-6-hydroxymethyldihydropteridine diphosphokinase